MKSAPRFLLPFSLLVLFIAANLTACQGTSPVAPTASPTATQTSTLVPPSPSPSAEPTRTSTAIAPSATPTLASFPELEGASAKPAPSILRPADFSAPLALSVNDHFYFSYPLAAASLERTLPSGRYGSQPGAIDKGAHTGLDIAVDIGTPVLAAGSGTVLWTGIGLYNNYENENEDDPYGVAVVIRHDFGYEGERLYSVYAHLSESVVVKGQRVETGEVIALSGNTGFSSGPHLHFELRLGSNTIYHSRNPELWLVPPEGSGLLVASIFTTYNTRVEDHGIRITNLESGRILWVYTYATELNVNRDGYYDENFLLNDLPAGRYEVAIPYVYGTHRMEIDIRPGTVSYFSFHGYDSFDFAPPPAAIPPHLPY